MKHEIKLLNDALAGARWADAATTKFVAGQVEYRLTTLPDEPALAWDVWVGAQGDLIVDKRDGEGLVRPAQTPNEAYLMVSIKRAAARQSDAFLRRRCHEWVATAFHGPPPTPGAIVEHLNDVPTDNRKENLCWSDHAENRARRTANGGAGVPSGKLRKIAISLRLIRMLQARTLLKGRALTAYLEALIMKELEERIGA